MKEQTKTVCTDEAYALLAAAVIKSAMRDYKAALRKEDQARIVYFERLFRSDYGQTLSFDHGDYIIEQCRKDVEEGEEDGEEAD